MRKYLKHIIVTILTLEARLMLFRHKPKIVVITGSVGKTSTKDAIAAALSTKFYLRKSEKSFNSDVGVPLTVLGLSNGWNNAFTWIQNIAVGFLRCLFQKDYPTWLVLEVGADKPGDLEIIFSWLVPDIVVTTRFPDVPVHIEFFSSPDALFKEESIPISKLKGDGLLILNSDDSHTEELRKKHPRVRTYGIQSSSDISGSNTSIVYKTNSENESTPTGMSFKVNIQGNSVPFFIYDALGKTHVYPILAAIAVSDHVGMNLITLSETFKLHTPPPGRMRIIEGKNCTIIDDSYNSSPVAVTEALQTIQTITSPKKKIGILGDMLELGSFTEQEHRKVGERVMGILDVLITIGPRAKAIGSSALGCGFNKDLVYQFENWRQAVEKIPSLIGEGDIVLVKGSQSIRLENIVKSLMKRPDLASALLVRQDPEWLKR